VANGIDCGEHWGNSIRIGVFWVWVSYCSPRDPIIIEETTCAVTSRRVMVEEDGVIAPGMRAVPIFRGIVEPADGGSVVEIAPVSTAGTRIGVGRGLDAIAKGITSVSSTRCREGLPLKVEQKVKVVPRNGLVFDCIESVVALSDV
jgi:hypothetical protein